jgi:hypothetical protein
MATSLLPHFHVLNFSSYTSPHTIPIQEHKAHFSMVKETVVLDLGR